MASGQLSLYPKPNGFEMVNDDRLTGLHHPPSDAFTNPVMRSLHHFFTQSK